MLLPLALAKSKKFMEAFNGRDHLVEKHRGL